MLVLTRKQQEKIHIGENISITVVRIKGNTVRVGIEAPRDVRVIRGEVITKDEASGERDGLTTRADQAGTGDSQSENGCEETIDKPSAPWQGSRNVRRGPLHLAVRNRDSVPTHAV
jgi:carbon storage regulator CsrA